MLAHLAGCALPFGKADSANLTTQRVLFAPCFHERGGHGAWSFRNGDAALGEDFFLCLCGVFFASNDGSCVAHAAAGRCGGSGDESGDGFLAVVFCPAGGLGFGVATDFTDHDDGFGFVVVVEHFEDVEVVGAVDGVSTDADAGALTVAHLRELEDGLVGEGAGA